MATSDTERALLRRAEERLEAWKFDARDRAYEQMFEGPNPTLTEAEVGMVDRIDSALARRGEPGLWDADEYGVVPTGAADDGPLVVCIYHPEVPYEGYRGEGDIDEPTRERINDALWDYAERVAGLVQADLDAFLRESRRDG